MAIRLACYWALLFVLPLTYANTTVVCNDTYSNTQGLQCFPCSPGYTKKDDCRTNQTLTQCTQCNEGTYQPHCISANETGECRNCTSCAVYIQNCTIYHDSVCGRSNNVKEGTSEGNGFLVLMLPLIWLFAVLVFGCAFVFCQYRYRQRGKQVSNNKWNNVVDREMHTDDYNSRDRSKGEYMYTITTKNELAGSLENRWSTLKKTEISTKNINSTVGKVSTIECLFGENDKKKAPRCSTTNIVDVHGDARSQDRSTTDESQVIKTKDVSEEKNRKLSKESKPIAVISPVNGAGVNSNHYGGLQLTRERFQFSGDSENTPKENTNNKGPTNNGTHAENQIVHVKELAESEEKGAANTEIDWLKLFRDLATLLPIDECSWTFFAIDLLHISREQCGLPKDVDNEKNKIKHNNKRLDLAYFELLNTWYSMMGSEASLEHIESALKRLDNKIIMEEFERIKKNPPKVKIHHEKDLRTATMIPIGCTYGMSVFPLMKQHCLALHEPETPSRDHSFQFNSSSHSQVSSIISQQCNPPMHVSDTSRSQAVSTHHAVQCSLRYETSINDRCRDQDSKQRHQCSCSTDNKKRKLQKNTNLIEQMRRYPIENAKQNLLADNIRKIDYDLFMEYVIDRVMKVCNVSKRVVLSITYQSFREIQEITTPRNETVYLLYSGIPYLNLTKEVYEDIKLYAMNVRTKLLDHLRANGITYNKEDVDVFLFITFTGTSVLDKDSKTKRKKIRKKTNTYSSPDHAQEPDSDPADTMVSVQNIGTEEAILQSESDITITDNEKNRKGVNISHIHGSTKQDEVDIGNSAVRRGVIHNENAPQNADANQNLSFHVPIHFESETENNLTDPQHRVPRAEGNAFKLDQEQNSKASVSQSQTAIDRSEAAVDEINFQDKKIPQNEVILIESDDEMAMIRDSFFPTGNETYTLKHSTTLKSEIPDILKKIQTQDGDDKQLDIKT